MYLFPIISLQATKFDHIEIVKLLLEKSNCDINLKNSSGQTPLMNGNFKKNKSHSMNNYWLFTISAIYLKKTEIVKLLLENKTCDFNSNEIFGENVLWIGI